MTMHRKARTDHKESLHVKVKRAEGARDLKSPIEAVALMQILIEAGGFLRDLFTLVPFNSHQQ